MSICDPTKHCGICDQGGLAVMPVRYAVARKDTLQAPIIQAPFGEGLEHAPLPNEHASSTLRQLRGGYLYMYNEKRNEWKAYAVNSAGYLIAFDIHSKSPLALKEDAEPCERMGKSAAGRCVMIPGAKYGGRVWLAFSDVAWTAKVLELHREASHREQHMRCIDIGEWAKSNGTKRQPHLAAMTRARERVAEFHVPPKPTVPTFGVRVIGYPAYDFSPQKFNNCHAELDSMLERADATSHGVPPAMVALMDPVGISLDLNALIATEVQAFEKAEGREWKKTTSAAIVGLRETLG
ncbi:MAG: T6SS effector BTH_I2691 family protein, partial [Pseudomonas sp.]